MSALEIIRHADYISVIEVLHLGVKLVECKVNVMNGQWASRVFYADINMHL